MKLKILTAVLLTAAVMMLLWALLSGGQQAAERGGLRIGVIDIEQVYTESGRIDYFQKLLEEKSRKLEKSYENEKEDLSEEEQKQRKEELYDEFKLAQQHIQNQLEQEVDRVIDDVARSRELDLILDRRFVRHGGEEITSDVIDLLRTKAPIDDGS